jgi:DNA-binding NtrC family response regulator
MVQRLRLSRLQGKGRPVITEAEAYDQKPAPSPLQTYWVVEVPTQGVPSLEEVEAQHIRQVLNHHGGNKTQAAQTLGIDRRTLYRKLSRGRVHK